MKIMRARPPTLRERLNDAAMVVGMGLAVVGSAVLLALYVAAVFLFLTPPGWVILVLVTLRIMGII